MSLTVWAVLDSMRNWESQRINCLSDQAWVEFMADMFMIPTMMTSHSMMRGSDSYTIIEASVRGKHMFSTWNCRRERHGQARRSSCLHLMLILAFWSESHSILCSYSPISGKTKLTSGPPAHSLWVIEQLHSRFLYFLDRTMWQNPILYI